MTNSEMGIQGVDEAARRTHTVGELGGEHTDKKFVEVFIDDVRKEIPRGTYTTEQLLTLLQVTPGYLLNLLDEKGQLQPLQPGEHIHVKDCMRFYSQAPGGGSA
jgi:hypothetical protein